MLFSCMIREINFPPSLSQKVSELVPAVLRDKQEKQS